MRNVMLLDRGGFCGQIQWFFVSLNRRLRDSTFAISPRSNALIFLANSTFAISPHLNTLIFLTNSIFTISPHSNTLSRD
jgi:hypothetical protein